MYTVTVVLQFSQYLLNLIIINEIQTKNVHAIQMSSNIY